MRSWILCFIAVPLLATGCKGVECGDGTIERAGACVPADDSTGDAKCGPFTELVGDQCVPTFPPTVCDDGTTAPDTDSSTGVVTCIGTGGGGCGAPLACPNPVAGKQTICGQIYDFETGEPFATGDASGARCATPATSGPCSLAINAYDAIAFATDPGNAMPLPVREAYIDDCGRYRISDITVPGGPFVGLGVDDADGTKRGPMGTTNTVGVATLKLADVATKNVETFVAPAATTAKWTSSGGPPISSGIYAMVFRANKTGLANMAGVRVTRNGTVDTMRDHYFVPAQTTRADILTTADVTGMNGTALVTSATLADGVMAYSGTVTLPPECRLTAHAGASLPFILFVQIVRPADVFGTTCPL